MKNQNRAFVIVILAIISTSLTFFAPIANEITEGPFRSHSHSISLFGGVGSDLVVVLTVIAGICFVLFPCINLFGKDPGKGLIGARISGIVLLIMQFVCISQSLNYYDDSSLFGALRSEVSDMSIHPFAIVTVIVTLITVILCFKARKTDSNDQESTSAAEQ